MKTYKINGKRIVANSVADAVKLARSVKDATHTFTFKTDMYSASHKDVERLFEAKPWTVHATSFADVAMQIDPECRKIIADTVHGRTDGQIANNLFGKIRAKDVKINGKEVPYDLLPSSYIKDWKCMSKKASSAIFAALQISDSVKDGRETYEIRWVDTYKKDKGYDRSEYLHTDKVVAADVAEALKKLADIVAMDGVGTVNCMVVHVSSDGYSYQFSGKLFALLKRTAKELGDSVNDDYTETTKQGYKVLTIYRGHGRNFAVLKRQHDYVVACGYHTEDGTWDQGRYDWATEEAANKYAQRAAKQGYGDSIEDADTTEQDDIQFLIDDELQAIEGYKERIARTNNPRLVALLSHILEEETEHLEELRAAQSGVFKIDDSVNDRLGEGRCAPSGANLEREYQSVFDAVSEIGFKYFNDNSTTANEKKRLKQLAKSLIDNFYKTVKRERDSVDEFDTYWSKHAKEIKAKCDQVEYDTKRFIEPLV